MSFMIFCILLFSGIVVCSVAAPVEETGLEYNYNIKNKRSNEESPVSRLEKKLNSTEKEITKLNQLIIRHYDESLKRIHQLTGPRFFSKWKSVTIMADHIDAFEAWDGHETRQYIITITRNYDQQNFSIYENTREGLRHSQTVTIPGASSTKNIRIDNTVYIAVSSYGYEATDYIESRLYNWTFNDDIEGSLTLIQTFNGTNEITVGSTGNETFIALTKIHYHFLQTAPVPSQVYKWDPQHRLFVFFQSLETTCGIKQNFFRIEGDLSLSIACGYNSSSSIVNSFIYKWNGSRFEVFQTIPLPYSIEILDLYPAYIATSLFLLAASVKGPLFVYRLSEFTGKFEIFQTIPISNVMALEIISMNAEHFIAVSSWDYRPSITADRYTFHAEVAVYRFSGSTYNLFQVIKTSYIQHSVKVFFDVLSKSWLMAIPEAFTIDLYKWNDGSNIYLI